MHSPVNLIVFNEIYRDRIADAEAARRARESRPARAAAPSRRTASRASCCGAPRPHRLGRQRTTSFRGRARAGMPSRHVGHAGSQPSSRFARSFEAPRISHIITTRCSPISRPTQRGKCRGGGAPIASATAGSHSRTGAGSSSTML